MISKCPLSDLERFPSYGEFGYGNMTEKRQGPSPGVRLIEVSVKRELTVELIPWMTRFGVGVGGGGVCHPLLRFFSKF